MYHIFSRKHTFLIFAGLLAALIIGIRFNWQNQKPKEQSVSPTQTPMYNPQKQVNDLLPSFPLMTKTIDPQWKKISIETTFTFSEGSQGGPTISHITARIPNDWMYFIDKKDFQSDNYAQNCSSYKIESPDKYVLINLQLICKGWSVEWRDIPDGSKIVKREILRGNDGPYIVSRIRVPESANNYSYFDGMVWIDSEGTIKNRVGNTLAVQYPSPDETKYDHWWQAVQMRLSYNGDPSQKEEYLQIADKIASTLFLE